MLRWQEYWDARFLAIRCKRTDIGRPYVASKIKYWTAAEDQLLGTKTDEEIAVLLGRSLQSVKLRRLRLGVGSLRR